MKGTRAAKKAGLLVATTLLSFATVETAFRVLTYLEDSGVTLTQLHDGIKIPPDGVVKLGHIIRRSNNLDLIYELRPNLEVIYEGARLTTNTLGMRSPEIHREPGTFTVVGIGDSFMFGQGVDEGENYLSVFQALADRRLPEKRVRVLNLAVPGYNTVMEIESLKQKGLAFDPNLVVIEIVDNDLLLPNFVRIRRNVLDLARSYAVDYFRYRLDWNWHKPISKENELAGMMGISMEESDGIGQTMDPRRVPPQYRHLVGWPAYYRAMRELRALSESHGFQVLVLSLAAHNDGLEREALRFSEELGFQVVDIGEDFVAYLEQVGERRFLGSPLSISRRDGHPSTLGHKIAGEALFDLEFFNGC